MADQLPRVAHSAAAGYCTGYPRLNAAGWRLVDSSAHYSAVRAGDNQVTSKRLDRRHDVAVVDRRQAYLSSPREAARRPRSSVTRPGPSPCASSWGATAGPRAWKMSAGVSPRPLSA